MQATTAAENTQTSSNPELTSSNILSNVTCYDPDDPAAACPVCGGMGWIKYNVPVEHPKFGKLWRCPNYPVAEDIERQERLRRVSNLEAFKACRFDNFEISLPGYTTNEHHILERTHLRTQKFAHEMRGWLLLEGTYGTGKTHLAAAIGNARLEKGDTVLFLTAPDLLDHLRTAFSPGAEESYNDLFERVKNTTLLILDDLGVENPSPWAQEKLFQLLNHRYSHMKPTVITTNNSVDDLDPRIRSRLLDNNMVSRFTLNIPDYRTTTRNENEQLSSHLELYHAMTFDNFEIVRHVTRDERHNLEIVIKAVESFVNNQKAWLLLTGGYGTGKTHLAAAIANHFQYQNHPVMFMSVPDLLDYLRTTFDSTAKLSFDTLFNRIRNVPLLVLDDLNTKQNSRWSQEKLFQLLDYRYVSRMQTVITTSQQVDSMDERLQTRFVDQRICKIAALKTRAYVDRIQGIPS